MDASVILTVFGLTAFFMCIFIYVFRRTIKTSEKFQSTMQVGDKSSFSYQGMRGQGIISEINDKTVKIVVEVPKHIAYPPFESKDFF